MFAAIKDPNPIARFIPRSIKKFLNGFLVKSLPNSISKAIIVVIPIGVFSFPNNDLNITTKIIIAKNRMVFDIIFFFKLALSIYNSLRYCILFFLCLVCVKNKK